MNTLLVAVSGTKPSIDRYTGFYCGSFKNGLRICPPVTQVPCLWVLARRMRGNGSVLHRPGFRRYRCSPWLSRGTAGNLNKPGGVGRSFEGKTA
eukprot:1886732-Rhodomonas_salina.1